MTASLSGRLSMAGTMKLDIESLKRNYTDNKNDVQPIRFFMPW